MNMEASEVLRLCCLLLFLASITSQNRSQNVYWLNGPMTMERDLKASDKDLSIYCYPGTSKNLFSLWQTVKFNVKINADDFEQVVAETPDRVIEKYAEERSIWNIAYRSKPSKTLPLNLFNTTCMGIQTQRWYSIELQLIRVDIWRVLLMTLGMAMIFSSRSLSENPLFFYLSGVTVGVVASFMIFVYYTSKLLPKKTLTYGILIGGWTVGVYLFQQIWENIRGLLASYQAAVFWYVAIASVVSFFVCYRIGPPRNQRSKDIVMWLLQLVGVLMIYCSSSYQEASAALVLVCLALKYFPDSLWYSMWGYWRRRFPPKPKLLSNEEYYEQGARETKRALEELRKYCSSPDCAQWRIMMKLNDSKRNGDLSKPSGGPRGRQWVIKKWKELAEKLNSEGTGESRCEEKWRKCKESQENEMEEMENIPDETEEVMMLAHQTPTSHEYWNTPGSSTDPVPRIPPARSATPPRSTTPHKSPKPTTPPRSPLRFTSPPQPPPQKKKKLAKSIEDLFIRCEMNAREDNRERDRMYVELERERIRQRDIELRQRDTELQLQAQWLEFMKEALNVLERFMDRNK